jgi:hypothetical protein
MIYSIVLNKTALRSDGKREYYFTISKMLKDIYGRYTYPMTETQDVCIISSLGYNTVNGFLRDYLVNKKTINSSKMFLGAKFAFKDWNDTYENQIDELNKTRNEFFLIDGKRGAERQSDDTTGNR